MTQPPTNRFGQSVTAVSLFAGVGGFDLALQRAGAQVVAAVEIDKQASGVLADRFPTTALFPDVTEVTGDQLRAAGFVPERGILTGGFPCQDLSVAGRRAGLAGGRSGLFWEIDRLLGELHPEWVLLENVPGLLSSNSGRDMGAVLRALGQRGYGFAYRVLDAQHFGVPQRRRRVFIVGHLGDAAGPVQVLLEPEGMRGDPEASADPQEDPASGARGRPTGRVGVLADSGVVTSLSASLGAGGPDLAHAQAGWIVPALTTRCGPTQDDQQLGQLVPLGFHMTQDPISGAAMPTLGVGSGGNGVLTATGARRLTPVECERLQGFPDDWTTTSNGKPQADAPRYRQMGNAVAVPVVEWIARRIVAVDAARTEGIAA